MLGIALCARIAGTPSRSCRRTLQTQTTVASLFLSAQSVNLHSFCIAIIAGGTLPRLASHSRSLPVLLVSRFFPTFRNLSHQKRTAAQLQKFEDSAPDSLEFDRLKEHFEPFIRASSLSSPITSASAVAPSSAAHSHHLHSNSITAAASAALARDIPGVSKYNPLARSTSGRGGSNKDRSRNKDEMSEYKCRMDITAAGRIGNGGGEADVDFMRHLETVAEVASLDQRWTSSWATSLRTQYVFHLPFSNDLDSTL